MRCFKEYLTERGNALALTLSRETKLRLRESKPSYEILQATQAST